MSDPTVYNLFMSDVAGPVLLSYFSDRFPGCVKRSKEVTLIEGLTDSNAGVRQMASHVYKNPLGDENDEVT